MQPNAGCERARRRGHWLKRDIVPGLWREDLRVSVTCEELDGDSTASSSEGERRAPAGKREAIVESAFAELGVEPLEGFFLAGWNPAGVEHQSSHRRQLQPPFRARKIRQ